MSATSDCSAASAAVGGLGAGPVLEQARRERVEAQVEEQDGRLEREAGGRLAGRAARHHHGPAAGGDELVRQGGERVGLHAGETGHGRDREGRERLRHRGVGGERPDLAGHHELVQQRRGHGGELRVAHAQALVGVRPGEGQATLELDEAAHAGAVSRLGRAALREVGLEAVRGPVEELRAEADHEVRLVEPRPRQPAAAEGGLRHPGRGGRTRSARTPRAAGPSAPRSPRPPPAATGSSPAPSAGRPGRARPPSRATTSAPTADHELATIAPLPRRTDSGPCARSGS